MSFPKNWLEYYDRKARSKSKNIFWVNGYDKNLSKISSRTLKQIILLIKKTLKINKSHLILDVGCGAGLITKPLSKHVKYIIGLDALGTMLDRIPSSGNIVKVKAIADKIPLPDNYIDSAYCHSIFQYFPSKKYAFKVVQEMVRVCKPNGLILIVDLPNAEKQSFYFKTLKKDKKRVKKLKRLFYKKSDFKQFKPIKIFGQSIKGYGNSPFRFNVLIKKV